MHNVQSWITTRVCRHSLRTDAPVTRASFAAPHLLTSPNRSHILWLHSLILCLDLYGWRGKFVTFPWNSRKFEYRKENRKFQMIDGCLRTKATNYISFAGSFNFLESVNSSRSPREFHCHLFQAERECSKRNILKNKQPLSFIYSARFVSRVAYKKALFLN